MKPNIRTLAPVIENRSFTFNQVQREGNVAIYSQTSKESDKIVAYETILIKQSPPHPHSKSEFDLIELYPSDPQFGLNGWSYGNYGDLSRALQQAQLKFNQLIQTQKSN